jgi:hypothetical protein
LNFASPLTITTPKELKMYEKTFSVDFYQIEMEGNEKTFEEYLAELLNGYTPDYSAQFFGTIHQSPTTNNWHGSIKTVRKNDLPQVFDTSNAKEKDLELAEAEGLLYVCSFMYIPKKRLLLVTKDIGAPGIGSLLSQVKAKNSLSKCEANILLKKEMYARLSSDGYVKRFTFRTAKLAPDALNDKDNDVAMVESLKDLSYGEIAVSLASRKRHPLEMKWVRQLIDVIRRQPKEKVKTLQVVVGKDEHDRRGELLNLLDYALVHKVKISMTGRTVQPNERERALERAFTDATDELGELGI